MKKLPPFFLSVLVLVGCVQGEAKEFTIKEASGVTRLANDLLIVGDEDAGAYYRYPLRGDKGPLIPIDPSRATRIALPQANLAIDLESIDVLADGRVAALSERVRALVGENGVIAEYDKPLSEFGNIGLEGLAVRGLEDGSSRIAVLWEGGYPDYKDVPRQLQGPVGRLPLLPVVWIHDLRKDEAGIEVKMDKKTKEKYALREIELDVPKPAGQEPQAQRFRAPDLVWHQWDNDGGRKREWGFIVLLSSKSSPDQGKPEFVHQWLQRFTIVGKAVGSPLDLNTLVPAHLKGANWEGLGWFEEGKSLVLIHDKPPDGPPSALVVALPEGWAQQSIAVDPRRGSGSFTSTQAGETRQESRCTPPPSLFENWKEVTLGRAATDTEISNYVESQRERVSKLRDPFGRIAKMTEAERAAAGERVLWEDDTIMALVDRFYRTPKPLVIPKNEMMFLIDASKDFIKRLAIVAAATSDALMSAAGAECNPNFSNIYINPPAVISVRQLHVHVQPLGPLGEINSDKFYARVSEYLKDSLAGTRPRNNEPRKSSLQGSTPCLRALERGTLPPEGALG